MTACNNGIYLNRDDIWRLAAAVARRERKALEPVINTNEEGRRTCCTDGTAGMSSTEEEGAFGVASLSCMEALY